jgi:hypothetical protein
MLATNNANRIDSPLSPSPPALPPPAEGSAKASLSTPAKIGPMALAPVQLISAMPVVVARSSGRT